MSLLPAPIAPGSRMEIAVIIGDGLQRIFEELDVVRQNRMITPEQIALQVDTEPLDLGREYLEWVSDLERFQK